MKAYQVLYTFRTEIEAQQAFDGWAIQDGFVGGRVYQRYNRLGSVEHVFQGFFPCDSDVPYGPTQRDGMSVVELSDSMRLCFDQKVFQYTTHTMEPEAAEEFLAEMAETDGFIGAAIRAVEYGLQVQVFFPAHGHNFGTVRNEWSVVRLPKVYIKWRKATVKRPLEMEWIGYAQSLTGDLRGAVMHYLASWDYIVPDEIEVRYLA